MIESAFSLTAVGVLLATAFFNVIFIGKSLNIKAHISYAALSLCHVGHILIPVFWGATAASWQGNYQLKLLSDIFWLGILSLLPIYLYLIFNDKHRKIKIIIIFCVCATLIAFPNLAFFGIIPATTLDFWEISERAFAIITVITSVVIALRAAIMRKKGAKMLLVGLMLFALGAFFAIATNQLIIWSTSFVILSVFMTAVMGRFFWDEMRKKTLLEAENARLELELLKGHIQPHFLLNSLNSIVAWIEEEPKNATKLVSELSKELRHLMAFTERETVSLLEEISLCRAHIQVMNLRKEKEISLEVIGDIKQITVPPLILHTALENGITHGFLKKDKGVFSLKVEESRRRIKIILENDGSSFCSESSKDLGTGNKYIVRRMTEIYGKDFSFESKPKADADGWSVVFEIPKIKG